MRQLGPEERRRWQSTTQAAPRRRYGADARLLFKLKPAWSYRLNADIEDHAEYAALAAEHPEWETTPFRSAVAAGYGSDDSLADMFRQIGCDEGAHKEISLARTINPPRPPNGRIDNDIPGCRDSRLYRRNMGS
jgi:hypothetical protein